MRKRHQSPERDEHEELSALPGFHAIEARLARDADSIRIIFFDSDRRDGRLKRLLDKAARSRVRCEATPPAHLDELAGGAAHQGVLAMASVAVSAATLEAVLEGINPRTLLLLLDGITDPRN